MDPTVELDADSLLKKTYAVGEEAIGIITQVSSLGQHVSCVLRK